MFTCLRHAAVWLFVFGVIQPAVAGQPERDIWYAYEDGDVRYGYQHVRVARLENGNYRYTTESRLLVDLLSQQQEMTGQSAFIVTSALDLVSFKSEWTQMSGARVVTGTMTGRQLEVTIDRSGDVSKSTYSFGDTDRVLPAVCLDDLLASLPKTTRTMSIQLIDEEGLHVETVELRRRVGETSNPVWELESADGFTKGRIICDAEGFVQERIYRAPKLKMRRCSPDQAREIDYKAFEGRELLTFPIDKDIGAPHRLSKLTVELTWEDIPFDEFDLEDARQRVVDRSVESGRYRAVVRIAEPRPVEHRTAYPVEDDRFKQSLAESRFIKPRDEGIRDAAQKAVGETKTALEAVKALSTWVNEYIQGALIAETLSGPEVLTCKKGKCSEYSTLFASLARAVGIPTRIVLGERMVAGHWMGHMWNEAYVGTWIPVDASLNEVGRSFGLLKFVHSDTVSGTQPLRWKLTETLGISIADFELTPSSLTDKYATGIADGVYTNVDFTCRLTAPVETWTLEDVSKPGIATIRFKIPEADDVLIHFVAFPTPPAIEPKLLIDARITAFKSKYEDFEQFKNEAIEVSGNKGRLSRFGGVAERDPSRTSRVTEVLWTRGSVGYLLNLIAFEDQHDKYLADFEKLVRSFEALEE